MNTSLSLGESRPPKNTGASAPSSASPLAGLSIVVVGGDPRKHSLRKTGEALGLSCVEWLRTRESHPSGRGYANQALKSQPDVVVLLVGLMRHQHFDDIRKQCRQSGVPYLILRRSFSAARLADAWRSRCYPTKTSKKKGGKLMSNDNPNYPSTTGNSSGGGRGNTPKG